MPRREGTPNKKRIELEHRRAVVAANMLAGATQIDIAAKLGVHRSQISRDVEKIIEGYRQQQITLRSQAVAIDLARIERLINSIWGNALEGEIEAMREVRALLERKSKLLGLDYRGVFDAWTDDELREYLQSGNGGSGSEGLDSLSGTGRQT